jgi:hypothetical protein
MEDVLAGENNRDPESRWDLLLYCNGWLWILLEFSNDCGTLKS